MAYPATIDSFVNPSGTQNQDNPDHALQHMNVNTAINAIENVVGTTNGTSIVKNFSAGDFAARINSGGTLQQALTGTINSSVFGTPTLQSPTFTGTITGTNISITDSASNLMATSFKVSGGSVNVGSAAAPSANQVLTATSGSAATWQAASAGFQSGFGVYLAGAQNTSSNGTDAKVNLDTKEYDLGNEFGTSNSRFTVGTPGKYFLTFTAFVQSIEQNQNLRVKIFKNGTETKAAIGQTTSNANIAPSVTAILNLIANDYIEFYVNQSGTAARTIVTGAGNTYAAGQRLV